MSTTKSKLCVPPEHKWDNADDDAEHEFVYVGPVYQDIQQPGELHRCKRCRRHHWEYEPLPSYKTMKIYRQALEWYANKENWNDGDNSSPIDLDQGARARKALEQK